MKHTPLHYIQSLRGFFIMKTPRSMNTRAHIRISQKFRTPKNSDHPKIPDIKKKFRTPKKKCSPHPKYSVHPIRTLEKFRTLKKFRTPKKFHTSFANNPGDRQTDRNTCACVHVHLIRSAHESAFEFLVLYYYSYYFADYAFI